MSRFIFGNYKRTPTLPHPNPVKKRLYPPKSRRKSMEKKIFHYPFKLIRKSGSPKYRLGINTLRAEILADANFCGIDFCLFLSIFVYCKNCKFCGINFHD